MDAIAYWLPVVWAGIIGIAVAMYVILDGFDLGLGILFPFSPEEETRDVMMNTVAPLVFQKGLAALLDKLIHCTFTSAVSINNFLIIPFPHPAMMTR